MDVLLPVLYTVFLWWFTTGLVIVAYDRSPRIVRLVFAGAVLLAPLAVWGIVATRSSAEPLAVYIALTCGVVLWGCQTASYYLGYVTGPRHRANTQTFHPPFTFRQRFWLALRDSLYHELLVLALAILLLAVTWGQANPWGFAIYATLWLMHSSAKLNVFLGVRNFRIDFLPEHLHHLRHLLGKAPINALFPITVALAPSVALTLIFRAIVPTATAGQTIGSLVLATMIFLGVLEHVLLVLPLPATLWGWGIRPLPSAEVDAPPRGPHRLTAGIQPLPERIGGD